MSDHDIGIGERYQDRPSVSALMLIFKVQNLIVLIQSQAQHAYDQGALMQNQSLYINRRNFRQEYNLLVRENEEVRTQNRRLKFELMKLMERVSIPNVEKNQGV